MQIRFPWLSVVGACIGLFMQAPGAIAQTDLKFADSLPKSFAYHNAVLAFKKAAEEKSKTLTIRPMLEGVLGDQKSLMEATKVGSIEICVVASPVTQQLVPEHGIFGLPFVWTSDEAFNKFLSSPVALELGKKMEAHGLRVLTFADASPLSVMNSKRAVRTPEDMKGLKIRVMQDPMQVDMIKAMGGIPVPMGTPEVYTAIQQGQIDGNATSPQLLWALKNHEVAKHFSQTRHGYTAAVVIMNLRKWNALSAEQKEAIEAGSKAFVVNNRAYYLDSPTTGTVQTVAAMKNAGVTVTEPDLDAFRKATSSVVHDFKKRVKSPLVDRALDEAGYK
ncbi:MAG: TRAP transporter substrate-binding protein [Burkholderiales bacterium]